MKKLLKPGRRYFIINVDEAYANKIYKILKKGQQKKKEWPEGNINFEQWKKTAFPVEIGIKNRGETIADIADEMADKIGIYGCGKEDHSDCNEDNCRICFVCTFEMRMEYVLEEMKNHDTI